MLNYIYTAKDPKSGKHIKAEVQAESEAAANKLIKEQGLSLLSITPKNDSGGIPGLNKYKNRVKTTDRILYSRQLATLINAGLPLIQSLRSVTNQSHSKPLKVIGNQIITDVEAGSALSVSLAKHPAVFNQIYISLVASGETSGTLDTSLERLALQQEKDAEIVKKVKGAMTYPIIVLLVMLLVISFMIVKVLPQVETLYDGLPGGNKLPFITVWLLALSHFIINFWWLVIISLVVGSFMLRRWSKTISGKKFFDRAKMKAWPVGPLFMKLYMARFARTGTTLVASGVPLIQMLQITGNAINNVHISKSLEKAIEQVKGGKALSDSIKGDPNFLDLVPDMLKIGEQSGTIEQMLEKTADYYEKEVDTQIKNISALIEPILMVILGVFAFIIVAAVLLPVYGLAGKSFT